MKRPFLTSIVFVIGCATGGVASQLVIPPARAGTNPTRWEYHCTRAKLFETPTMNKIGAEGWELVSAVPGRYERKYEQDLAMDHLALCFKRALP